MICEFRNQMNGIVEYIFDGEYTHILDESETNLYDVLYYTFAATFLLFVMGWWLIPIRWIFAPLKRFKFVCKRHDRDDLDVVLPGAVETSGLGEIKKPLCRGD